MFRVPEFSCTSRRLDKLGIIKCRNLTISFRSKFFAIYCFVPFLFFLIESILFFFHNRIYTRTHFSDWVYDFQSKVAWKILQITFFNISFVDLAWVRGNSCDYLNCVMNLPHFFSCLLVCKYHPLLFSILFLYSTLN